MVKGRHRAENQLGKGEGVFLCGILGYGVGSDRTEGGKEHGHHHRVKDHLWGVCHWHDMVPRASSPI